MYDVLDLAIAASLGAGVGWIVRSIQLTKLLKEADETTQQAIALAKEGRDVVMEQRILIDKQSTKIRALRRELEAHE